MHLEIIRDDGLLDLGAEAQAAGFGPGTTVEIVKLSTGNLLVTFAVDQPSMMDMSRLLSQHGRRALPRQASPRKRKGVDNAREGE